MPPTCSMRRAGEIPARRPFVARARGLPVAGLDPLADLALEEVAFERAEIVDERDALQMVVFVQDAARRQVHRVDLEPLAVDVLCARDDALWPLDLEVNAG